MNNELLYDNNLIDISIYITCGFILSLCIYYVISSNYTAIPSNNIETITNEEIEAIVNENAETIINNENIDAIIDSDSDTEVISDYQSISDDESILDVDIFDLDLFFMPNVDFNVCSIQELKYFEFTSLYSREMFEHSISNNDVMEFISWFSNEELATNWINDVFLYVINLL
jgi:hypothetical protein